MATLIQVIDAPSQELTLSLNNQRFKLNLKYNYFADRWTVDIYRDNQLILAGRKLLIGFDLVESFGFGMGALVIIDTRPKPQDPNRFNLPSGNCRIYHISDAEIAIIRAGL